MQTRGWNLLNSTLATTATNVLECELRHFHSQLIQYYQSKQEVENSLIEFYESKEKFENVLNETSVESEDPNIIKDYNVVALKDIHQEFLQRTLPGFIEQLVEEMEVLEKTRNDVSHYLNTSLQKISEDLNLNYLSTLDWDDLQQSNKQLAEMLKYLQENKQFLNDLQLANRAIEYQKNVNEILKIITTSEELLTKANCIRKLSWHEKLVYNFAKYQTDDDFNFMVEHIGAANLIKELPVLFKKVSDLDHISLATLQNAYTKIYTSPEITAALKKQHHIRIGVALALSLILTPLSLAFTIPWILYKRNETLIEKITFKPTEYAELKYFKSSTSKTKSSLFNKQGQLRKIVDATNENGSTDVFMRKEQANRLKKWIKLKKEHLAFYQPSIKEKTFFQNSKNREKTTIDKIRSRLSRGM